MNLITAEQITKSYREKPLLENISFTIAGGDKIGLIGVNGTGKSTFLKILAGLEEADSGAVTRFGAVRIGYLPQLPDFDNTCGILDYVTAKAKQAEPFEAKSILTRLGFENLEQKVQELSGGQKKRVAIAAALLEPCELLILDEPTNHLDSDMIEWLEKYLAQYKGALLMVTHDRYFLDRVTNRILEIEKGRLYSYQTNYSGYLTLKSERQEMEQNTLRKKQSLYAKELEWMQRGARARGTKSKERIARFETLEEDMKVTQDEKLELSSISSRLGKKTVELAHISKTFNGHKVIGDFSYILLRDARIGIVGRNGCGKSTLLNILCGRMIPDEGEVIWGKTVKIGYVSQENEEMDLTLRVIDFIRNIAENIQTTEGTLSASQLLERFLFPPDLQFNTISRLSGGERRRLYLLSILASAPNILVLDEPTNDLDIETLTILEEYLESFPGAVVTVSHDRYFLDKVVNRIFAFEGGGKIRQYVGGYSDYAEKRREGEQNPISQKPSENEPGRQTQKPRTRKLKFTYREEQEFQTIDSDIEALENQLDDINAEMQRQASDFVRLSDLMEQKTHLEAELEEKMERWVYLHDLAERIEQES